MPGRSRRARIGTALFWIVGGSLHFVIPRQYEAIVPTRLQPWRKEIVVASGAAEIAGGVGVLPNGTRRLARWWLLATLVAVYPANIHMAVNSDQFPRIHPVLLWARLPLQFVCARMTWRGTR